MVFCRMERFGDFKITFDFLNGICFYMFFYSKIVVRFFVVALVVERKERERKREREENITLLLISFVYNKISM